MQVRQFLAATLLLGCSSLFAQTTSTSILGTVTDQTGAAVQGAKVVITNVRTGVIRDTVTSGTGDYSFPLLDVGEYNASVEAPGFKAATTSGIVLQINEKVRAYFKLEVGNVQRTHQRHRRSRPTSHR